MPTRTALLRSPAALLGGLVLLVLIAVALVPGEAARSLTRQDAAYVELGFTDPVGVRACTGGPVSFDLTAHGSSPDVPISVAYEVSAGGAPVTGTSSLTDGTPVTVTADVAAAGPAYEIVVSLPGRDQELRVSCP